MIKNLLIFLTLFSGSFSFAKTAPKTAAVAKNKIRHPAQAAVQPMKFKVVFGDKVSLFVFTKNKSGAELNFSTSMGDRIQKQVTAADYNFLRAKVAAFSGVSNSKEYCARKFISILSEKREEKTGCIGSQNKLAKDMLTTVNLATTLL